MNTDSKGDEGWRPVSASARRLSVDRSQQFATLFRAAITMCGFRSIYGFYLETDLSRATLERWMSARVRIPVAGAQYLISTISKHSPTSSVLRALQDVISIAADEASQEDLLRAELRARRVPVQRTLAALRAANVLPPRSGPRERTAEN
jgi:hypothetical protein